MNRIIDVIEELNVESDKNMNSVSVDSENSMRLISDEIKNVQAEVDRLSKEVLILKHKKNSEVRKSVGNTKSKNLLYSCQDPLSKDSD